MRHRRASTWSLLAVLALGAVLMMQGCGGDTKATTTTKAPKPAHTTTQQAPTPAGKTTTTTPGPSTTTTTTTTYPRSKPMSVKAAVEHYKKLYFGYAFDSKTNSTPKYGPLGVTISFAAQASTFTGNLFCSKYMNTHCFNGQADCRMSAALFNWKMISKDFKWASTMSRATGYIFNDTMVQNVYGKCSYVYDGADGNGYNRGCGIGAPGNDCNDTKCAFYNICPSTGKECKANDTEVKQKMCTPWGPAARPVHKADRPCLFPGPAFNYPIMDQPNHLREMVNYRMLTQLKTDDYVDWNEVVIDEKSLIPEIWKDPAVALPALVVTKSSGGAGKSAAKSMQAEFSKYFSFADKIPIVGINDVDPFCTKDDWMCKTPVGPFYDPDDDVEVVV